MTTKTKTCQIETGMDGKCHQPADWKVQRSDGTTLLTCSDCVSWALSFVGLNKVTAMDSKE